MNLWVEGARMQRGYEMFLQRRRGSVSDELLWLSSSFFLFLAEVAEVLFEFYDSIVTSYTVVMFSVDAISIFSFHIYISLTFDKKDIFIYFSGPE